MGVLKIYEMSKTIKLFLISRVIDEKKKTVLIFNLIERYPL